MQLIDIISEYEAIAPADLDRVISLYRTRGGSLAELLLREALVDEEDLFFLMSRRLGVPAIPEERLLHLKLSPEIRRRVPSGLARECVLVPLDLDQRLGRLSVAMYDPTEQAILDLLRRTARVAEIRTYLARRSAILEVVAGAYGESDEVLDPDDLEELPWLGQIETSGLDSPKHLDPSVEDPKVEIDPSLQEELAVLDGQQVGGFTDARSGRREVVTDEMLPIEAAEPPAGRSRAALTRPLELHGHSLLRDRDDSTRRRSLRADEPGAEPYHHPGAPEHRTPAQLMALIEEPRRPEVDTDPFPLVEPEDAYDGVNELDPLEGLELEGAAQELELGGGRRLASGEELEHEITQIVVTPDLIEDEGEGTGLTRLPEIAEMEDLDALLRELLPSVGVLVAMLEERIDPAGGSYREYGRLSRLVAREIGMDELAVSRVALAAHLFSLDLALRREVGTDEIWDVEIVFSNRPPAPGGLGPSLRGLGGRALALPLDDGGDEPAGLRLIRLVVDYIELRTESELQGAADLETVAQLLRTGGAEPAQVDALVRAVEASDTPALLVEGADRDDSDDG